ncbi:MAG TPA: S46 family peptidase, partial [Bacteroidia bacterium]|nr:S46 family peptidase [Bacteroidia bacterium]
LRVTFGPVRGYNSKDGLICRYYTTSSGILQKEDSTNSEFVVPKKLKELFMSKDFGPYANKNRELPVAFTCAHHTTGGNSGSPVIDKEGNLIGVNFDRNWEATASDIIYNDDKGRNLVVDIRYVLFVIDKFAGASNLVNEMKIVK